MGQLESIVDIGKLHASKEKLTQLIGFQDVMVEGTGESSATMNLANYFKAVKNNANDVFPEAVQNV